ncbi:MAG: bifunctional glutamate N-acetyltransferase/amino-acid acetyltransferase ArgJ [Nitrospinota bacterium]
MTPKGFKFSAISAGVKKSGLKDIGLIVSDPLAAAAAVFTNSGAKAAPVLLSMKNIGNTKHRAIICNSGCANAATGKQGAKDALKTLKLLAAQLGCATGELLVASTGGISTFLPMKKIEAAMPKLASTLGRPPAGFCRAIMTTDAWPKQTARSVTVGGRKVTVWGGAKGAGMIHPDMATMLGFILTDAAVRKPLLQSALKEAVDESFNTITVDGDTSTNDTVFLMANGAAGAKTLKKGTRDWTKFVAALKEVCGHLAEKIVTDGEGAKRIAHLLVEKAANVKEARLVAEAVAGSLLVKTALHGGDPNWGRIIAAVGYSGAEVNPEKITLYFGPHCAYRNGLAVKNVETRLAAQMRKKKVMIRLLLGRGKAKASMLFCDIGHNYVTLNSDYRT